MDGMIVSALIIFAAVGVLLGMYIHFWLNRITPGCSERRKRWVRIGAILLTIASLAFFRTPGVLLLHFWVFAALTEFPCWLYQKISWNPVSRRFRLLFPLLCTCAILVLGLINMNTIVRTAYTYQTDKAIPEEGYRIAILSDIHYGTVQDPRVLQNAIPDLYKENPDLILLVGDIVEEGTDSEEMEEVFRQLGELKSTFGTYFVYGNHDRQNYARNRAYSPKALEDAIRANGITILQDTAISIDDHLKLVGREDLSQSSGERAYIAQLLAGTDPEQIVLLMDHQPADWEESAASGVDIQVSGHTHAGQFFPIGQFIELFGGLNYGQYSQDNFTCYVTSGFTGWGYYIRTSQRCEYVILDILPKK